MTRTYLPAGICIYVSQANFTIVLFGSHVSLPPPKNTHTHTEFITVAVPYQNLCDYPSSYPPPPPPDEQTTVGFLSFFCHLACPIKVLRFYLRHTTIREYVYIY